jgi:hypothetical protein
MPRFLRLLPKTDKQNNWGDLTFFALALDFGSGLKSR